MTVNQENGTCAYGESEKVARTGEVHMHHRHICDGCMYRCAFIVYNHSDLPWCMCGISIFAR